MKIAIFGLGQVGKAIGRGLSARGHEVTAGSRDPESVVVQEWVAEDSARRNAARYDEAARWCEFAFLTTPWTGTQNALDLAEPQNLAGKTVVDVTNPLAHSSSGISLALGHDDSGGEQVQRWLPEAHVVKGLNILNFNDMVDPQFPGGPPDMFICGNDEEAKKVASEILVSFGWPVTDVGGIEGSRLIEPLAMLWIVLGIRGGRWGHAFKLLWK